MSPRSGFVERGRKTVNGLTVTTWGPRRTEPQMLREHFAFPDSHAGLDDESLQAVIDGAKEWIAGRRWSWTIVACNYLRDGRYHA
jgi:hypothetical protein